MAESIPICVYGKTSFGDCGILALDLHTGTVTKWGCCLASCRPLQVQAHCVPFVSKANTSTYKGRQANASVSYPERGMNKTQKETVSQSVVFRDIQLFSAVFVPVLSLLLLVDKYAYILTCTRVV